MSCNYNCTTRDAVPPARAGRGPQPTSHVGYGTSTTPPSGQRGWNTRAASPSCFYGQSQNTQGTWQGRTPTKPVQSLGQHNQTFGYSRGYNSPATVATCEEPLNSGYPSTSYPPSRSPAWRQNTPTWPPASEAACVGTYSSHSHFPTQTPYPTPSPTYHAPPPTYHAPPTTYTPPPAYSPPMPAHQPPPPAYQSPVRPPPLNSPGCPAYQPRAGAAPQGNLSTAGARMLEPARGAAGGPCWPDVSAHGMLPANGSPATALRPVPRTPQHVAPYHAEKVSFAENIQETYVPPSSQRGQASPKQGVRASPSHLVARLPEGPEGAINLQVTLLSPHSLTTDSFTSDSFHPDSFAPDALCPDSFAADAVCTVTFTPEPVAQDSFAPGTPSHGSKEGESRFLVSLKQSPGTDIPHATTPFATPSHTGGHTGGRYEESCPEICPNTKPPAARREDVPLEVRALFSGVADVLAQPDAGDAYRQPVKLRGVVTPALSSPSAHAQTDVPQEAPSSMPQSSEAQQATTPPQRPSFPCPPSSPQGRKKCLCSPDTKPPQVEKEAQPTPLATAVPVAQSGGSRLTSIRRLDTPAGPVWSAAVSADGASYDVMATLATDVNQGAA